MFERGNGKERKGKEEEIEYMYVSCDISLSLIPLRRSFTEPGARLVAPESLLTLHPSSIAGVLDPMWPHPTFYMGSGNLNSALHALKVNALSTEPPLQPICLLLYKKLPASLQSFSATNHLINNSKAMNINIAGFKDELDLVPAFRELHVHVELNHSQIFHPDLMPARVARDSTQQIC